MTKIHNFIIVALIIIPMGIHAGPVASKLVAKNPSLVVGVGLVASGIALGTAAVAVHYINQVKIQVARLKAQEESYKESFIDNVIQSREYTCTLHYDIDRAAGQIILADGNSIAIYSIFVRVAEGRFTVCIDQPLFSSRGKSFLSYVQLENLGNGNGLIENQTQFLSQALSCSARQAQMCARIRAQR